MSLQSQISDFITRLGTELKTMKSQYSGNNSGSLSGLVTTVKTSLLAAINEVKSEVGGKQANLGFTPENVANKGAANGYPSLDSGGKVPMNQLPAIVDRNKGYFTTFTALTTAFPTGINGDYAIVGATDTVWIWDSGTTLWVETDKKGAVISVNGQTGAVTIGDATTGVAGLMSTADKIKLNGIASGATANDTDANLKNRANHTGTQLAATISDFAASVLATVLSGLSLGTNAVISAADTVLTALGKLQAQISAHVGAGGGAHANASTSVAGFMSGADKTKLDGVAAGATLNDTDANLKNRANHTGTQSADTLTDGTTNKAFLATERTKLAGIAAGATANDTDANLKNRANHTGTQLASTISDLASSVLATLLTGLSVATNSAVVATDNVLAAFGKLQAQINGHFGAGGTAHAAATTSVAGFQSAADKTKLDGIATGANNYAHPTSDGNIHLPANGTTNTNKVPKAGASAGSWSLDWVSFSELAGRPTSVSGYGITDAFTKTEMGDPTTNFVTAFDAALV
jgi:hypothetical protein